VTTSAGRWAAVTASVRGASHERNGKPNQDAVRVVQTKGPTPGLVAAVCDGHGGDRYVRSDVGSRLGAEVACDVARRAFEQLVALPSRAALESQLAGPLAEAIVQRWRERVLDDVRARPFTGEEAVRARAPLDRDPLISYGCTLLLAVMTPSWVGLLQIGDGDVTVVRGASVESPVPDDDRLVGGETTSLCLPSAVADTRVHVLAEPLPDTLILTTDGYANSFADPNWRTHAGTDLRDQVHRIGLDAVEARLPAWLADSASAGGDDVSMALIQRMDASPPAAGPVTSRPVVAPVASAPARSGMGRGALVGALAAAVVIGAGIGWIVARPSEATTAAATTTVSVSVSTSTPQAPTTVHEDPTIVSVATTVAPTTLPPTTTTAPPHLAAGEQTILFTGNAAGTVLVFDPRSPTPTSVRFYGDVTVDAVSPELPTGWSFDGTQLLWKTQDPIPASFVARTDLFVWAISPDGATLTSFDPKTGKQTGGPIPFVRGDPNTKTPDVAPSTSLGGASQTQTPTTKPPGG